jgi:DNA-binding XRE family transcriptional regulator
MYQNIIDFMSEYDKTDFITIKTNIRRLRKSRGLTPKFFESKIGIPSNQYGQFEKLSYKYKPALETCIKLCHAMEEDLMELLVPIEIENPKKSTKKAIKRKETVNAK